MRIPVTALVTYSGHFVLPYLNHRVYHSIGSLSNSRVMRFISMKLNAQLPSSTIDMLFMSWSVIFNCDSNKLNSFVGAFFSHPDWQMTATTAFRVQTYSFLCPFDSSLPHFSSCIMILSRGLKSAAHHIKTIRLLKSYSCSNTSQTRKY